jgi:N-acetylglucosamine kinase-like BadF-type ATPase
LLSRFGLLLSTCRGVCAGAAGASDPLNRNIYQDVLKRIGFTCPILIITDVKAAFIGALGCIAGITIISGTGSICLACDSEGNEIRTGGWGSLISDEGSGYDIGRNMLHEVMRAYDENRITPLKAPVFSHFNVTSHGELIRAVNRKNVRPGDIAALAPVCIEIAESEGGEALDILEKAAFSLCGLISSVYGQKYTSGDPVVWSYGGGVLTGSSFVMKLLTAQVRRQCPALSLYTPKGDAASGAVTVMKRYLNDRTGNDKWLV